MCWTWENTTYYWHCLSVSFTETLHVIEIYSQWSQEHHNSITLTLLRLVTHICVCELGQHWFRQWLVVSSAPSHCPNQRWLIVNWTLRNKLQGNFNWNSYIFIKENAFENVVCIDGGHFVSMCQCVDIVAALDLARSRGMNSRVICLVLQENSGPTRVTMCFSPFTSYRRCRLILLI